MPWKEVDPGPAPERAEYRKLSAIGDKAVGQFVSGPTEREFPDGRKSNEYAFQNKDGRFILTANYDLDRRLKKAIAEGLKPGMAVAIQYVSNAPQSDPNKSGMKLHKVMIDDTPRTLPAPPPPKPQAEPDDIPF